MTQGGSEILGASVPIYARLVGEYRQEIVIGALCPGDRIDSITEIQRRHGVSRETAKRVLSTLARDGYIIQRPGKGSFVADLRPTKKIWGVVLPFYSVQYEDLLLRLRRHAALAGCELHHFYDDNDWQQEVRLVQMMLEERYQGVVVVPTLDESRTWDFYSSQSPQDTPVVLLDHTMSYHDFSFVIQSYDLGVVRALNYLIERSPGRIGFVQNSGWLGRNMVLELMHETFRMVLASKEREGTRVFLNSGWGVRTTELQEHGVTGLFCCDDVTAIQVIGRLKEQGLDIPRQMNVVSYGNTELARFFTPAITSVDPNNEEMADQLAGLLRARAAGGGRSHIPVQHVVQPQLVVRQT